MLEVRINLPLTTVPCKLAAIDSLVLLWLCDKNLFYFFAILNENNHLDFIGLIESYCSELSSLN